MAVHIHLAIITIIMLLHYETIVLDCHSIDILAVLYIYSNPCVERFIVNPRRACAARVNSTWSVCQCSQLVSQCVCPRLFSHCRQPSGIRAIPTTSAQQAIENENGDFAKTKAFEIEKLALSRTTLRVTQPIN